MINVYDYEYAGKIRLTTVNNDIYVGQAWNVVDKDYGVDELYPDDSLVVIFDGGNEEEFYQKDIAIIEVLEPRKD